jgi:hypothetical protein
MFYLKNVVKISVFLEVFKLNLFVDQTLKIQLNLWIFLDKIKIYIDKTLFLGIFG